MHVLPSKSLTKPTAGAALGLQTSFLTPRRGGKKSSLPPTKGAGTGRTKGARARGERGAGGGDTLPPRPPSTIGHPDSAIRPWGEHEDPDRPLAARLARLRTMAADLHPTHPTRCDDRGQAWPSRIRQCGWFPLDRLAPPSIAVTQGRETICGVRRCGGIWQCAECAAIVSSERAREVQSAVNQRFEAGGHVYMWTATVSHDYGDRLEAMRRGIADAFSGVLRGAPWRRFRDRYGIDTIRRLESTIGSHGWHPHLHVMILSDRPIPAHEWAWLDDRWCTMVDRYLGAEHVGLEGIRAQVETIRSRDGASRYLTKLGLELTDAFASKSARNGNRTTWGLLAAIEAHVHDRSPPKELDRWIAQWDEWVRGMRGAKQLTWSRGLRAKCNLDDVDDRIVVELDQVRAMGAIDRIVAIPADHASRILRPPHVSIPLRRAVRQGVDLDGLIEIVGRRAGYESARAFELANREDDPADRIRAWSERRAVELAAAIESGKRSADRRVPLSSTLFVDRSYAGHVRGVDKRAERERARAVRAARLEDEIEWWRSLGRQVDHEWAWM